MTKQDFSTLELDKKINTANLTILTYFLKFGIFRLEIWLNKKNLVSHKNKK